MDRRKIDDVEAHRCHVRKPFLAIAKGSVAFALGRARSREQLVPCGETCFLALDSDGHFFIVAGGELALRIAPNQRKEIGAECNCRTRLVTPVFSQPLRPILKYLGILTRSSPGGSLD